MNLNLLKMAVSIILIVILVATVLWLRHQQQVMDRLRKQNVSLRADSDALQTKLLGLKAEAICLSMALNEQQKNQHQLDEESEQTWRLLRHTLAKND